MKRRSRRATAPAGRVLRAVSGMVSAALVLSACSGSGGGGSFSERLELIPASTATGASGPVLVAMADLDRAAQLAGVQRPADAHDADAVAHYVLAVSGLSGKPGPVAALMPDTAQVERSAEADQFAEELGWSIANVSWFAEVQNPPGTLMVAGGGFDEGRLDTAMGERRDDVWRVGGDDGTISANDVTPARPLGESLRTALVDGHLVVARFTPPVQEAVKGGEPTLADDAVLRSLAAAMDGQDAYSALLTSGGPYDLASVAGQSAITPRALATLQDQVLPQPFRGVAAGLTSDNGTPIVLLAYAHDSADAATANADALGTLIRSGHTLRNDQPWSDLFTVQDIRTDGSTLIARLGLAGGRSPLITYQVLQNRDGLVTHR